MLMALGSLEGRNPFNLLFSISPFEHWKLVWNSRRFEGEQKVISVIDCKIKQLEIISECVMYGVSVSSPCIVRTNHLESNR